MRIIVFALLACLAYAQRPAGDFRGGGVGGGIAPEDFCTIAGTAADSNGPLSKVNLMLMPADSPSMGIPRYSTATDKEGRYVLKDIEPGRYRFWVSRNGYVRQEYGAKRPGRAGTTLTLNKGQQLSGIDFALLRQSVIAGRVLDEDSEPVSRVFVQALRYSWIRGRKQLVTVGSDQTDDRGQYRIHDLPAGKYLVSANYRGDWEGWLTRDRSAADAAEESYVATYYPGTTDAATAATAETSAGTDALGVDIRLRKIQTVHIRGKVSNQAGWNPSRYRIMLLPRGTATWSPMDRRTAQVNANGNFEIRGVAPGSYTLSADSDDQDQQGQSGRIQVDVGRSPIDGFTLTISSGSELKGHMKMEEGAQLRLDNVHVLLTSRDNPFFGGSAAGPVKEDGSFTVPHIAGELLDVGLRGLPSGHYLKSVRYGQEDALANGLNLSRGVAETLELVISPNAAKAEGVVVNDKQEPVSGATVVIAPDAAQTARPDLYKSVTTDQTGHYAIESIPPGKYRLFAFEDLEQGAAQDADYLKEFEQKSEKADLQQKATFSKQLGLIPTP